MGRNKVALGMCHDGVSGAKGSACIPLEEEVFFPEEGKEVIQDGW